uniref:DNA-directed RNA polymerase subunit alpha n=1 Tax=Candidatus Caldatribacterium californiense TaxID=1454726 RepID=A0A7V4DGM4_9BACT
MQDLKSLMKCELLEFREDPVTHAQYGKFAIEPFESGWGITVGNALRRVLLSSIEGAAVTAVQIDGIIHEFSPLPGVREDVTDLILNLKGLVVRSYSESETLYLDVRGTPGALRKVTARDIRPNPNVEIINLDHYLAELEENGHLSMRIFVGRGKGYREAEEDTYHTYDIIPVDAMFSPVRKVNFQVMDTRVGQFTNYDKVLLEIWTNGAITPQQAFRRALELLVEEFSHLLNLLKERIGEPPLGVGPGEEKASLEEREMTIEELELSVRAYNCLKRARINTVRELLEIVQNRPEDLKKIKNLGQKTYEEIIGKLERLGYRLGEKREAGSD